MPKVWNTSKVQASKKRTVTQRERDLVDFARLYLRGYSQVQLCDYIAKNRDYHITQQQVSLDIKTLHQRWLEAQLIDFNAAKAKELSRIDALETSYWEGWENSLKIKEIIEAEKVNDQQTSSKRITLPTYARQKTKKKTETSYGDIRFLDGVSRCIELRCKIFGFNAPTKVDFNWRQQAEEQGVNPDDVLNDLVKQFVSAATVEPDIE